MWQLQIELKSRLCPGSGLGSAGYADRDIVFDEFGLPYLPGRRLKGLLRESLWEIHASGVFADVLHPDKAFGPVGAEQSACVDVGDAQLKEAHALREWLKQRPPQVTASEVLDRYTEIVRQTAMDSVTGSPLEDTLRATRVLRPHLRFFAPIRCSGRDDEFQASLERAAAGLQFMGIARTRGWGWVRCSLQPDQSVNSLATEVAATGHAQATGECVLSFHVRLERNALCPVRTSDPNTVRSEEFIPGSAVHGLLARRHLNAGALDQAFYDRFFSERVRFLSA